MLVLPVFLTRHSSIKVRRENDCKDKTQILKIKKKTILSNFNNNNQSVYQIPIYSCLLARIFNPQPFRSNICFYVICCFFVFFSAFFLNLRRKFKLYFSVQCSQFRFQTFQLFFSLPNLGSYFLVFPICPFRFCHPLKQFANVKVCLKLAFSCLLMSLWKKPFTDIILSFSTILL